jgi:hypothetical protein
MCSFWRLRRRGRQRRQKRGEGGFRTARRRRSAPERVNGVDDDQCEPTISVPERSLYDWTARGSIHGDGRQMDAGRGRAVNHIPLAARLLGAFTRPHRPAGRDAVGPVPPAAASVRAKEPHAKPTRSARGERTGEKSTAHRSESAREDRLLVGAARCCWRRDWRLISMPLRAAGALKHIHAPRRINPASDQPLRATPRATATATCDGYPSSQELHQAATVA